MNRVLQFALLVNLTTVSACASRPPETHGAAAVPAGTTSPVDCMKMTDNASSTEKSIPVTNKIQILAVAPPAGSNVQRSTVLVVDLSYSVKDFDSGKYLVFAQFDIDNANGRTTDGTFNSYPSLKYAIGSYRVCFPLTDIWNVPNVKKPLSVRFLLNKVDDARHNHSIAFTDRIFFPTY